MALGVVTFHVDPYLIRGSELGRAAQLQAAATCNFGSSHVMQLVVEDVMRFV